VCGRPVPPCGLGRGRSPVRGFRCSRALAVLPASAVSPRPGRRPAIGRSIAPTCLPAFGPSSALWPARSPDRKSSHASNLSSLTCRAAWPTGPESPCAAGPPGTAGARSARSIGLGSPGAAARTRGHGRPAPSIPARSPATCGQGAVGRAPSSEPLPSPTPRSPDTPPWSRVAPGASPWSDVPIRSDGPLRPEAPVRSAVLPWAAELR
jgi:hypothetical protein